MSRRFLLTVLTLNAALIPLFVFLHSKMDSGMWRICFLIGFVVLVTSAAYWVYAKTLVPLFELREISRQVREQNVSVDPEFESQDVWDQLKSTLHLLNKNAKLREKEVNRYSRQLEQVFESMEEGVLALDHQKTVLTINAAAQKMLGIEGSNPIGRKILEVCRFPEFAKLIDNAIDSDKAIESEFETTGASRNILLAKVSKRTDETSSETLTIVLHDVTEMRRLETMRRDFFSNVSHELKTPLSSIKAYAETLKLGAIHDTKKRIEFIDQIEAESDRLNQQIQDLLQLSRVESGHYAFEIGPVSLKRACVNCIQRFEEPAKNAGIELVFEDEGEDVIVEADEEGIATILDNLVSNAIRYTPAHGMVTLAVIVENRKPTLQVLDTGIGIPGDKLERVFERFYRVDKARSRQHGGTGLGLSIVKHLTQAFGGSVRLESRIGGGSMFTVELQPFTKSNGRS